MEGTKILKNYRLKGEQKGGFDYAHNLYGIKKELEFLRIEFRKQKIKVD